MVNRNRKFIYTCLAICLILIHLLTACQPSSAIILLSSECEPPCWKGIYPGRTTKDEAAYLLNTLPEVDQSSITFNGRPRDIFEDVIYFDFKKRGLGGWIHISNGKVSFIQFFSEGGNGVLGISFSNALKQLGEPQYILNIPTTGGIPGAPTTSYRIFAFHPERGISFNFDTRQQPAYRRSELRPENKLGGIAFFDPEFFEQLLDAGYFSPREYWTPWDGYGKITKKYPPVRINE